MHITASTARWRRVGGWEEVVEGGGTSAGRLGTVPSRVVVVVVELFDGPSRDCV